MFRLNARGFELTEVIRAMFPGWRSVDTRVDPMRMGIVVTLRRSEFEFQADLQENIRDPACNFAAEVMARYGQQARSGIRLRPGRKRTRLALKLSQGFTYRLGPYLNWETPAP